MSYRLPIGINDFEKLVSDNFLFANKTLLIKDIIDDGTEVVLFTRLRRFGKTINLSMLKYFFEKTTYDSSQLFKNLQIWECGYSYTQHQGKYPVIFITLKRIKAQSYKKSCKVLLIYSKISMKP